VRGPGETVLVLLVGIQCGAISDVDFLDPSKLYHDNMQHQSMLLFCNVVEKIVACRLCRV
jgi:hypothetical protein